MSKGIDMCEFFGWFADCLAVNRATKEELRRICNIVDECFEDWKKSGGRMGGYFDKA